MGRLELNDIRAGPFSNLLDLCCGKSLAGKELTDVFELATIADRLQMTEVCAAMEDLVIGQLTIGGCADALMASDRLGLNKVEAAAKSMALGLFEEFTSTEGFMSLDEAALGALLDEDSLAVSKEEAVYEGLLAWMQPDGPSNPRGRELLRKIRFPLMADSYLAATAKPRCPPDLSGLLDSLLSEAVAAKASCLAGLPSRLEQLGPRAMTRRVPRGVAWESYVGGGEVRGPVRLRSSYLCL